LSSKEYIYRRRTQVARESLINHNYSGIVIVLRASILRGEYKLESPWSCIEKRPMRLIIIRGIDNRLTEIDINFVSMIVIFTAAVIPVYIAIKLNNSNNNSHTGNNNNPNLKKLAIVLAVFILAHGVYHITRFLGFTLLAEGVFEPLSITILIAFGVLLYYNNTTGKKERQEEARA
jgi:hypothetical protein